MVGLWPLWVCLDTKSLVVYDIAPAQCNIRIPSSVPRSASPSQLCNASDSQPAEVGARGMVPFLCLCSTLSPVLSHSLAPAFSPALWAERKREGPGMSSWPGTVMTWGWMPSRWDTSSADSFSRGDFLQVLGLPQLEPQDAECLLGLVTQSSLFPWASSLRDSTASPG